MLENFAVNVACTQCGQPYPRTGVPYCCPSCGGIYDFTAHLAFDPQSISFGVSGIPSSTPFPEPEIAHVSLGEGNTPLVPDDVYGREVYFKCEYLNPTGSFKDRGSATLVSFLRSRNVTEAIEDSSGNAGASFAAYAARAGIQARVFVPELASGAKRRQIELYGAEIIPVPGPRSAAAQAAMRAVEQGAIYASHAWLPFNIPGYASAAFELFTQLGQMPGAVIVPAGQGGLLLGLLRGFDALRVAMTFSKKGKQGEFAEKYPILVGVQSIVCAPLCELWQGGTLENVSEETTLAEGICVQRPLRGAGIVETMHLNGGRFVSAQEAEILPGRDELAHRGFYVEPTSAIVWPVLERMLVDLPDPVVVMLTGSGLKI